MKLTLDPHKKLTSIVSLYDLSEENILKNGSPLRSELLVSDIMHSRETLNNLDYADLAKATFEGGLETQK